MSFDMYCSPSYFAFDSFCAKTFEQNGEAEFYFTYCFLLTFLGGLWEGPASPTKRYSLLEEQVAPTPFPSELEIGFGRRGSKNCDFRT